MSEISEIWLVASLNSGLCQEPYSPLLQKGDREASLVPLLVERVCLYFAFVTVVVLRGMLTHPWQIAEVLMSSQSTLDIGHWP